MLRASGESLVAHDPRRRPKNHERREFLEGEHRYWLGLLRLGTDFRFRAGARLSLFSKNWLWLLEHPRTLPLVRDVRPSTP
jgi:hypothetical protein